MANHNKFKINSELPTPGANHETVDTSSESTQEQEPLAQNPAEKNVENAKTRLESLEDRGAELRGQATEKLKGICRGAVSFLDRQIGRVASGAEKMRGKITDAREYAGDLKDAAGQRMSQRQARKERKATAKERAKSDAYRGEQAEIAAQKAREQAEADSVYDEAHRENMNRDWQAAKQEHMDNVHEEALEENERREQEAAEKLREEIEAERKKDREFKAAYENAADYLKQFSNVNQENRKDLKPVFDAKFSQSGQEDHVKAAYESAFSEFEGKMTKAQAFAKRRGEAAQAIKTARTNSREAIRNAGTNSKERIKNSETYQKAQSLRGKLGRMTSAIASKARSVGTRIAGAATAGFNSARENWQAAAPSTEAEPVTNE